MVLSFVVISKEYETSCIMVQTEGILVWSQKTDWNQLLLPSLMRLLEQEKLIFFLFPEVGSICVVSLVTTGWLRTVS